MLSLALRAWNGLGLSFQTSYRLYRSFGALFVTSETKFTAVTLVRAYHEVHLIEDEMEENFIKGWGKGGQSVNKSNNCVQLKHKPTGIIIKCHETRSLARNRVIARELLKQKLDYLYNGNDSALAQSITKRKKRKADYARKRRKREEALTANQRIIEEGPKHEES